MLLSILNMTIIVYFNSKLHVHIDPVLLVPVVAMLDVEGAVPVHKSVYHNVECCCAIHSCVH